MFIISIPLFVDTTTVASSRHVTFLVFVKTTKDKQAQIVSVMQHSTVRSINDIKLTLHTTFNIPKGIGNIYIRDYVWYIDDDGIVRLLCMVH
jgi:hypothetical protein